MYGLYGIFFENCTDCTDFFGNCTDCTNFSKSFGHPAVPLRVMIITNWYLIFSDGLDYPNSFNATLVSQTLGQMVP